MSKKKMSTDEIVRNLFDPLSRGGVATEEASEKEKNVFFQKKETVSIQIIQPQLLEPVSSLPSERRPGARVLFWLGLASILFLAAHFTLSTLERDSEVQGSQTYLIAKQWQSQILTRKLVDWKREARRLNRLIRDYRQEKGSLASNLKFLESNLREERQWADLLSELARLSPRGIWFKEFSVTNQRISIRFYSFDQMLASQFLDGLNQSSYFKDPVVLSIETLSEEPGALYSFEVDANVLL